VSPKKPNYLSIYCKGCGSVWQYVDLEVFDWKCPCENIRLKLFNKRSEPWKPIAKLNSRSTSDE